MQPTIIYGHLFAYLFVCTSLTSNSCKKITILKSGCIDITEMDQAKKAYKEKLSSDHFKSINEIIWVFVPEAITVY